MIELGLEKADVLGLAPHPLGMEADRFLRPRKPLPQDPEFELGRVLLQRTMVTMEFSRGGTMGSSS